MRTTRWLWMQIQEILDFEEELAGADIPIVDAVDSGGRLLLRFSTLKVLVFW